MLNKSSSKTYLNILLLFSFLSLFSCAKKIDNRTTEIRIVDLNGQPKQIKRIMPEGNAKMLAMQNKELENNNSLQNNTGSNLTNTTDTPTDNLLSQNNQNQISTQPFTQDLSEQNNSSNIANNQQSKATISYDMSEESNDSNTNQNITQGGDILSQNDQQKIQNIESTNNNSSPQATPKSNKKFKFIATKTKVSDNVEADGSKIFIQIGFFSSSINANNTLANSKKIANGSIKEVNINGQNGYKVFLGPIKSHKEAITILKKAKKSGYKDAFIAR